MQLAIEILVSVLAYISTGVSIFIIALGLFIYIMPRKEKLKKSNIAVRFIGYIVFLFGYILDIVFNLFYAGFITYYMDRSSELSFKDSEFLPNITGLTFTNWYRLTLTSRLQTIIDDNNMKRFVTKTIAFKFSAFLNSYAPDHINLASYPKR